jgi:hypothetical protein
LCTPTGSGKTTIAEIAILQSLYPRTPTITQQDAHPLAIYLVPSRALAAEVEAKLQRVIAPLTSEPVIITGLYGGIDWGPTDAWLTATDRTVLICTYEKAEALIRFLGPLFLGRVSLIVLDEAHLIQYDGRSSLSTGENRQLRLESLVARLLVHTREDQRRIIGLSAVAAGIELPLAQWLTGRRDAAPERTIYRSTRQLIGRLECLATPESEIKYDLLDRASLRFTTAGTSESPFIRQPFPPHPAAPSCATGNDKRLRPYLFWAAMHFVAPAGSRERHAVLIYAPEHIEHYMSQLLILLEQDWRNQQLPIIFEQPVDPARLDKWQRCLAACADYFGAESREYRLLQRGIVAHHGKMPGMMARLLVQLVEEGIIHLILATSTLSEGVNLPFETVLVPSLLRGNQPITATEFANLAGRAGRPGYGTEGRILVLLRQTPTLGGEQRQRVQYQTLIQQLRLTANPANRTASSALAVLLKSLFDHWAAITTPNTEEAFFAWLDQTATIGTEQVNNAVFESLDALDGILLAAIVELEALSAQPLTAAEMEAKLIQLWQRCYAHYASSEEQRLSRWFVRRGQALGTTIYPDRETRRRLYRTGLPPRQGTRISELYPGIKQHLQTGASYAVWTAEQRFLYIKTLVELIAQHPRFALAPDTRWADKLRWWLDPQSGVRPSNPTTVSTWYSYISKNFTYRITWGLGLVLSIAADEAHDNVLEPTTLESFPDTELPWVALWLKELIAWGTLDPVTAYLLGRGRAGTRRQAQQQADAYYSTQQAQVDPNEFLNPTAIRTWADALAQPAHPAILSPPEQMDIELTRDFSQAARRQWRVVPAQGDGELKWVDPAGFLLATGPRPANWSPSFLADGDFLLDIDSKKVRYSPYL